MPPTLLFLAHRIPYPPNKGDKIRSFHLLKHLAAHYRIYLGAFVDDPADWAHHDALQAYCSEVKLIGIRPFRRKLLSLRGLLTGEALSLPYYRHAGMRAWVRRIRREAQPSLALAFSSPTAQYLLQPRGAKMQRIADFVDVDSQKWQAFGQQHRGPLGWLYRREARRLLEFERRTAAALDRTLFVSDAEAALFRRLAPACSAQVSALYNGVDSDYFAPDPRLVNPYTSGQAVLVFTGAMDYWANVDAVVWFAEQVFPAIRQQLPQAGFVIVGGKPASAVTDLARQPGIQVTGAVPDVRPYVQHAHAAVAPMRIARGIQNKVLEAMAMAKPVLATPAAMEGIDAPPRLRELVTDDAVTMAHQAVALLNRTAASDYGAAGRQLVQGQYAWPAQLAGLDRLLAAMPSNVSRNEN